MKLISSIKSFCFLAILVLLNSCGNPSLPDDSLSHVPDDISGVTAINLQKLMQKVDLEQTKELEMFQDGLQEIKTNRPSLVKYFDDFSNSGIDINKNAYMVFDVDENNPKNQFAGMVVSLSDPAAFEQMLLEAEPNLKVTNKAFKSVSEGRNIIAWDNEVAVIAAPSNSNNSSEMMARFFNSEKNNSVKSNRDLGKCLSKDYDVAIWMNSNALAKNEEIVAAASLLNIKKEDLEDNYFHSYLSFEEGIIKGKTTHHLKPNLTNDLKLFFKDGIKQDLSKFIPAEDLNFTFSASLDAKGMHQIIQEKAGGTMVTNTFLKKFGFTSKDIAKAFGGDFVGAMYGDKNDPVGLLTSTISDKATFKKFIDLGMQYEVLEKRADNFYALKDIEFFRKGKEQNAFMLIKDDLFFVSNNKSIIETIQSGGFESSERMPKDIYNNITSNAFGAYANFLELAGFDSNQFESLPFTNAQFDGGLYDSNMTVELENKEINSLKALMEAMNQQYLKGKKDVDEVKLNQLQEI